LHESHDRKNDFSAGIYGLVNADSAKTFRRIRKFSGNLIQLPAGSMLTNMIQLMERGFHSLTC